MIRVVKPTTPLCWFRRCSRGSRRSKSFFWPVRVTLLIPQMLARRFSSPFTNSTDARADPGAPSHSSGCPSHSADPADARADPGAPSHSSAVRFTVLIPQMLGRHFSRHSGKIVTPPLTRVRGSRRVHHASPWWTKPPCTRKCGTCMQWRDRDRGHKRRQACTGPWTSSLVGSDRLGPEYIIKYVVVRMNIMQYLWIAKCVLYCVRWHAW